MSAHFRITVLSAVLCLLAACSGQRSSQLPVSLQNPASARESIADLPAPARLDQLRGTSELVETLIGGAFTLERSAGAEEQGTALTLDASAGGPQAGSVPEWALYGFDAGSNSLDSLQVQLDVAESSQAYILLADFNSGRWETHGPVYSLKTLLLDDPKYLSSGGTMYCAVLVPRGNSATVSALSVRTINPNNLSPTADLQASALLGLAPFNVDFDASASIDPEGSIIEYAWDWDGNGGYEEFSDQPQLSHNFTEPGIFDVQLRVSDDHFARDTATVQISVNVVGNIVPVATLNCSASSGSAPLAVELDAVDSFDLDGNIQRCDYDLDGDNLFELYDAGLLVNHTYSEGGDFQARLRVTDNRGAQAIATTLISVNSPPEAVLQLLPNSVEKGSDVLLDASSSSDSDGSITLYEWDTDGDGSFDTSSATDSSISINCPSADLRTLKVRVTDDFGATGIDTAQLHVRGWNVQTVESTGMTGNDTSIAIVNGLPGIAYVDHTNEDLRYVRASDPQGSEWEASVTVDNTGVAGFFYVSLCAVNGSPAIAYHAGDGLDLRYIRASDANGSSWGPPQIIELVGNTGWYPDLKVVNGNPAVSFHDATNLDLRYVRAADADGVAWNASLPVDTVGSTGTYSSMAVVNGVPAISYYDAGNTDLRFARALDADGTAWGVPQTLDSSGDEGKFTALALINGNPAIAYQDVGSSNLRYIRSADVSGSSWNTPVTVDASAGGGYFASLASIGGRPAIAYANFTSQDAMYVLGNDANGSAWGSPQTVDTDSGWWATLVALPGGQPGIAYRYTTDNDLRYAIGF